MIEIYRKEGNRIKKFEHLAPNSWINMSDPTGDEIDYISDTLDIPRDFITDPLDPDERSRIEIEDGIKLVIIRLPKKNEDTSKFIPYITFPVGIILTSEYIITVCREREALMDLLSHRVETQDFTPEKRKHHIFTIFRKTVTFYLRYLKEINHLVKSAEVLFNEAQKNEEILRLLNMEKSLVYFETSLKSNELVIEKLLRNNVIQLTEEDRDEMEDIMIDNKQAIEMSTIYSSIVRDMMDAFSSVIGNNLNFVMKFLTSITIILMIPTLVTSFYGMNIPLPFQHHPYSLLIVSLISLILTIIGIIIFAKRKLF